MLAVAFVALIGSVSPAASPASFEPPAPLAATATLKLLPTPARLQPGLADLPASSSMPDMHTVGYDLGFTPNVAVSMSTYARASESGATFRIGDARSYLAGRLQSLGVRTAKPYGGGAGRWYLFAAVRNQALDAKPALNGMSDTAWLNGIGAQAPAAVSSSGKLGFGWSKGALDTSVGYVQRQVRVLNGPMGASNGVNESVAALSFTFRPH